MHPAIEAEIIKARIADRQRQAGRIAIARAARRASRGVTEQGRYPAVGLPRRVLTVLAARRLPALARSRHLPARQPSAPCSVCV
ncbi:MAG TPA: hypothetical protein VED20_01660 [Streptosporangiaceae bacterium]|nr:hypothetical protein [Streptosporangiaceae bacterium]